MMLLRRFLILIRHSTSLLLGDISRISVKSGFWSDYCWLADVVEGAKMVLKVRHFNGKFVVARLFVVLIFAQFYARVETLCHKSYIA